MNEAEANADSIKRACESYLSEEDQLRAKLRELQEDLDEER